MKGYFLFGALVLLLGLAYVFEEGVGTEVGVLAWVEGRGAGVRGRQPRSGGRDLGRGLKRGLRGRVGGWDLRRERGKWRGKVEKDSRGFVLRVDSQCSTR